MKFRIDLTKFTVSQREAVNTKKEKRKQQQQQQQQKRDKLILNSDDFKHCQRTQPHSGTWKECFY